MSLPSSPSSSSSATKNDWSASQYLLFNNERTRPVHDLISQVKPHLKQTPHPRIYDLGCGPGNSTQALLTHFPTAHITGLDTSPAMLAKARATLPDVEFVAADVATLTPADVPAADILFSNAVFHWLRSAQRIPALTHLLRSLPPGGVLALQVPDNYTQPSHTLMRATAVLPRQSWAAAFAGAGVGDLAVEARPDLDPIEAPGVFYDALSPFAQVVHVWRTEYMHVLEDARAIVEWVRGTGLQPFLQRIEDDGVREEFLDEYERALKGAYREMGDGKVLLGYPRLFVVAVRK
ncbi:hypothetical protein ACN47E_009117 [Coniothyrium glycines]